ncbi:MAG: nitroreductase family protein [Thaumarchaeota archaeon]|nr:nitroreductase family protein [Candidatus Calditenuaceae archaeon]MDW8186713.1 nitroreductase family protein [Nitrososphaerota archaeon]
MVQQISPEKLKLLDLIKSRRSSKLLREVEVPTELIVAALEVASCAPSAHNAQPWRVVIVKDRPLIVKLLEEMAMVWRSDLRADGHPEWRIETIVRESVKRTLRASALLVVCLTMDDMDVYPDERRRRFEYLMAVQSVAAFIQNLLLALHALGLGACWRSGPLFAPEAVRRVLNVPEDVEPQALIEIGSPGGERPPRRRPLSEIAFMDKWGNPL